MLYTFFETDFSRKASKTLHCRTARLWNETCRRERSNYTTFGVTSTVVVEKIDVARWYHLSQDDIEPFELKERCNNDERLSFNSEDGLSSGFEGSTNCSMFLLRLWIPCIVPYGSHVTITRQQYSRPTATAKHGGTANKSPNRWWEIQTTEGITRPTDCSGSRFAPQSCERLRRAGEHRFSLGVHPGHGW